MQTKYISMLAKLNLSYLDLKKKQKKKQKKQLDFDLKLKLNKKGYNQLIQ